MAHILSFAPAVSQKMLEKSSGEINSVLIFCNIPNAVSQCIALAMRMPNQLAPCKPNRRRHERNRRGGQKEGYAGSSSDMLGTAPMLPERRSANFWMDAPRRLANIAGCGNRKLKFLHRRIFRSARFDSDGQGPAP